MTPIILLPERLFAEDRRINLYFLHKLFGGISAFVKVPYITNISRFKKQMMSQNITVHYQDKHEVDIKALRKRLGVSQEAFAGFYGLDVATLRNWEQGRTEPDGPATVLLRIIENDPEATLKLLYKEFQGQLG